MTQCHSLALNAALIAAGQPEDEENIGSLWSCLHLKGQQVISYVRKKGINLIKVYFN